MRSKWNPLAGNSHLKGEFAVAYTLKRAVGLVMSLGLFVLISGRVWIESSSARTSQVYILLLLPALVLTFFAVFKERRIAISIYAAPWLAFIGWVALSTTWAGLDLAEILNLAKRGLFLVLFLHSIDWLLRHCEAYIRRAIFCGVIVVALGALAILLYKVLWLSPKVGYRTFRLDRLGVGDFINYRYPLAAGLFHGAAATWAFSAMLDRRNSPLKSGLWFAVFAVLIVFVFFTYARSAWFGIVLAAGLSVLMTNSKKGWWIMGVGASSLLILTMVWWEYLLNEILNRKLSGRGPIWDYYFEIMPGNWLFGFGLGTPFEFHWADGKTVSPHAHSLFLQQAYDSGLIGLGLLLAGITSLGYLSWRLRSNHWIQLAAPALLFAITVMLTDVERIFTRPNDYWTIFWLPVAIILGSVRKEMSQTPHGTSQ
ncbi:O-antigen ligase family protein [Pseudomonas monteilii]|uniref:O-antigen ligase family protein n=1 Tax=Pseudomonas monteilii TaxID=76759 RepID=UPI0018AC021D|nr:O-antigen ligase family protein [Pseudomonas monteilii]MBF8748661.1 O-antigen ligase family protein [Pseudomonas monteilii]